MHYVGIDIAKRKHEASIIGPEGNALCASVAFPNTKEGCDTLIAQLVKLDIAKNDVVIGMEATGHYWLSVYSYLLEVGYDLKVINPIQSDAFRGMYIRQTKNDSKDSFIIAQIMRFGQYSTTRLSEESVMALRQLSRYRLSIVDECSDCKRKVIALLDQVFPEYDSLFSDVFGRASKEVLLNSPTPEDMLQISSEKLGELLAKASKGRFKAEKAAQLKAVAAGSFGIAFAKDAFAFQIKQLIEQINFLEKQREELEDEISLLLTQINVVITTIPGIGTVLGAAIIGEIGDINRFDAPGKLVAFAGLDATVNQSGEFNGTKSRLSKRGSPYLRRAIWLAASSAVLCDPILSSYYQSLRARGKHHLTAVSAVARKICNILFTILKENRPYEATPPKRVAS